MNKHQSKQFVIINADDFGITKGVNKAILELVDAGIVSSTTVMSNMPHHKDIIDIKNKIGVGIHFNLTVGYPVTEPFRIPTLVNKQGNFHELPELLRRMKQGRLSNLEVEIELTSQIQRLIALEIQPDHIDSHESLLKYPFFMKIMKKLARQYKIMAVRTYSPRKFDLRRLLNPKRILISILLCHQKRMWINEGFHVTDRIDSIMKFGLKYNEAIDKLNNIMRDLPVGVLELVTHPAYCIEDNTPLGGYDYEREIEMKALLSEDLKIALVRSGVKLISYSDI